jgi:transposase
MVKMNSQYSAEFKIEAIKRIEKTGDAINKVAEDLGIKPTTLHGWVNKFRKSSTTPFPGSGKLAPEDERIRKLERENRELKEENEILKKAATYFAKNLK